MYIYIARYNKRQKKLLSLLFLLRFPILNRRNQRIIERLQSQFWLEHFIRQFSILFFCFYLSLSFQQTKIDSGWVYLEIVYLLENSHWLLTDVTFLFSNHRHVFLALSIKLFRWALIGSRLCYKIRIDVYENDISLSQNVALAHILSLRSNFSYPQQWGYVSV